MDKNTKVYFKIFGISEEDSLFLQRIIDVDPYKCWKAGELLNPKSKKDKRKYKENGYSLVSSLKDDSDIIPHLTELIEILNPIEEQIKKFGVSYYIEFVITVYFRNGSFPQFSLTPDVMKYLVDINAHLEFDIYDLGN